MRMLCYKCNHSWNYKGSLIEGKIYVTCPNCVRKVRVDESLIEDSSKQTLLTSLSKKSVKTTSFPLKLPITTTTTSFIEVEDGLFVEKKIAQQFKEALEDKETPPPGIEPGLIFQEEVGGSNLCKKHNLPAYYESFEKEWLCDKCIEIPLPGNVKLKTDNLGTMRILPPKFKIIRVIPRDPIKLIEHMRSYI